MFLKCRLPFKYPPLFLIIAGELSQIEIEMKNTPINYNIVQEAITNAKVSALGHATIREIVQLVNQIEKESGERYIRMEMGVPGLKPPQIGVEAEIEALRRGVSASYPMLDGVPALKEEASRFLKNFMNIAVRPQCCVPTVGSMQGSFVAFMVAANIDPAKDTALFIDPGFPVQKQQLNVMGLKHTHFDLYDHRGSKLREKLESFLQQGNIHSIIYSNPNNPSWACLTEEELKIIGEVANKYDIIIIEDLAYFGMDFREDISVPGQAPYQPTVAQYTDNYILLISSSKAFSNAGQRLALLCISEALYDRHYPQIEKRFDAPTLGHAAIQRIIYSLTSGTSHSAQYGLAAVLKAANDGEFNFIAAVKEYGERAHEMKRIFTENGFEIVYDKDGDAELADGFYFTIAYPGMHSDQLIYNLLFYGISAISLSSCGSDNTAGLRACVSQVQNEQLATLEDRVKQFAKDFKID